MAAEVKEEEGTAGCGNKEAMADLRTARPQQGGSGRRRGTVKE